jgi:hypothetical protein
VTLEQRQHGHGGVEQALDIGIDHLLPVLEPGAGDGLAAQRQAAIVEEAGDGTEIGGERRDGGLDALLVREVERGGVDEAGELGLERFQPLDAAACSDDLPAVPGEQPRRGGTETGGGAGDENDRHLKLLGVGEKVDGDVGARARAGDQVIVAEIDAFNMFPVAGLGKEAVLGVALEQPGPDRFARDVDENG